MQELRRTFSRRSPRIMTSRYDLLNRWPIILVSNRGPVEYRRTPDANLKATRGSGGVVTALSALSQYVGFTWIAAAMTEGDRYASVHAGRSGHLKPFPGQKMALRFVGLPKEVYERHYNVFSNPILWFVQHTMGDRVQFDSRDRTLRDAWQFGYEPGNLAFAEAVVGEARRSSRAPVVMLHDYHLYLAPKFIRRRIPEALLQHFVHIPWPEPEHWRPLPADIREAICRGLLNNDIVGFQTKRSAQNFARTCEQCLADVHVDADHGLIRVGDHLTYVRSYPISIDPAALRKAAFSVEVRMHKTRLGRLAGQQTIVRVDRVDPSKNIVRGFEAFDLLLRQRADLRGRVKFLAFLVPSRTGVPEYGSYTKEVMAAARVVNERHAQGDWVPIELFYENNYLQAIAGMSLYDVLLVNPVADGMNLVCKEGPIVNEKNGVLVLSKAAGAYEQLQTGALPVDPTDVADTAAALSRALDMPQGRRQILAERLREAIEQEDLASWLQAQFTDIAGLLKQKAAAATWHRTFRPAISLEAQVPRLAPSQ